MNQACASCCLPLQVWQAVERALIGKTTMLSPRLLVQNGGWVGASEVGLECSQEEARACCN